jgi:hypothetical protein
VDGVTTVTVLGTFPYQGTKGKSVRESPVLRAVMSADHAGRVNWDQLSPADVPTTVDVWWLQGAFANVDTEFSQPAPPLAATDASLELTTIRSRLGVASAHLDEALKALESNEIGIGRSQFKQFFDVWDEVDQSVAQRYPAEYEALDMDLERAEIALLHSQPEDFAGARAALQSVQSYLSQMTLDR